KSLYFCSEAVVGKFLSFGVTFMAADDAKNMDMRAAFERQHRLFNIIESRTSAQKPPRIADLPLHKLILRSNTEELSRLLNSYSASSLHQEINKKSGFGFTPIDIAFVMRNEFAVQTLL